MKSFLADLHVHTCLSPCAADEMTPPAIVRAARAAGLSMIAICDHNTAGNAAAVQEAARREFQARGADEELTVIAGMEITTQEEVHVVGLFPDEAQASSAAAQVLVTLPEADEEYYLRFGPQHVCDAAGHVTGCERKMLAMASSLGLNAAVKLIHRYRGLAIAAHVDRPSFSVVRQLGVFPTDAGFDAIEIFTPCGTWTVDKKRPAEPRYESYGLPIIASSDGHFAADIGRARTVCELEQATFDELLLALRGKNGRTAKGAA